MFKQISNKASGLKREKKKSSWAWWIGSLLYGGGLEASLQFWAGFMSGKRKAAGIAVLEYSSTS